MHAEIIAIGDELTSGQRLDTNSQWLSDQLGQLGVLVRYHTCVGDDLDATAAVFRSSFERADIVICTGGLGPTADDLARESLAAAMGVELQPSADVLKHVREIFERRGREMPESNQRQAMFPVGSQIIPNPNGTAPGIAAEIARPGRSACHVFTLPGVPIEMRQMWADTVEPTIRDLNPAQQVIRHRVLKCFGLGESHLEQRIGNIIERGREPAVGITVHEGTITLRITAMAISEVACTAMIEPVEHTIREQLGDIYFGTGDIDLAHAVAELLTQHKASLAVVEFGTGGWLGQELASLAEQSNWFGGGLVQPSPNVLAPHCEGDSPIQIDVNSTAADIEKVATACRAMFSTDYALAIGPYFASEADAQLDRVHLALGCDTQSESQTARLAHHPSVRAPITSKTALNMLRRKLLA
jgi:nicotinamide-nucleotide amidase